jgi:NAD(P)H-hydrate repair Nnr-like enzyme with NAD(P)H-hydrate dehydratase domain
MCASILAQGAPFESAVKSAVFFHALAGKSAGQRLGQRSVIARDVISSIPDVIKAY